MSEAKLKRNQLVWDSTKDLLAILISAISFIISTVNVYVSNLKSPDLDITVALYVKQVVDSQSLNEAFFVPLTIVNQGARTGTILSFELNVTYNPTAEQEVFFGQYYAQENNSEALGNFFTPLSLNGYSTISRTVCFYPQGKKNGNFFLRKGLYEFKLTAKAANVNGEAQKTILRVFKIELTQEMFNNMQMQPDKEYVYPIQVELAGNQ